MEEVTPIQQNSSNEPNPFMGGNIGGNSFLRKDEDTNNPGIRDESKGPGIAKRFARPAPKPKPEPTKPSFFRGRRDVTKREIVWKLGRPNAYKNLWDDSKSRPYKEKMKALVEKHFTKGQYEHYTKAELSKITRAIEKEVNKEGGSWQIARKDMAGRIKDIIN